jgi:hypothetical protein
VERKISGASLKVSEFYQFKKNRYFCNTIPEVKYLAHVASPTVIKFPVIMNRGKKRGKTGDKPGESEKKGKESVTFSNKHLRLLRELKHVG